ncbi:putative PurR-regulated permease PerM [Sphingomonas naasensis]|uniref:AI-2E family transporter n=1 Tax=Sphingomonas naasensis TaxID=1344951 RepID=A0A4S1WSH3_9SPHN|nr:AI-2E family transporter [Sphingomonas naasensis]NIJ18759.1 putative PurR-regulated permease PerM [Sphingomonas naasensis]TGX45993.1 AI-2E family transporter [Sphingomonas naasensis]
MGDGEVTRADAHRRRWLALAALALAVWIAREFLTSLLWALVLAIALWPLLRGARTDAGGNPPGWAAFGLTLAAGLVLMLPLVVAALEAAQESGVAMAWLQTAQTHGIPPPAWLADVPLAGSRLLGLWQHYLATPGSSGQLLAQLDAATILDWVKGAALAMAQGTLLLFVTLVALFTMLRHGASLGAQGMRLIAASVGHDGEAFAERLVEAVRVTVVGTVFVALGEGALIGVGYAIAGVPKPMLFALMTAAFAMLPFGAWFVFSVASVVLLLAGAPVAAALLFVYGAAVMLVGDNIVQPALIGRRAELPFLLALIGIFGGIASMGLVGLFIGPVIMTAVLIATREWLA